MENKSLVIKCNFRRNDWSEFEVVPYRNGKREESGVYYTQDREDAEATLADMKENYK